jgi:hypothetical protein
VIIQNLIQPVVKGIGWGLDYLAGRDPQALLPFSLLPGSHRHAI